jgi:hypothetical protein
MTTKNSPVNQQEAIAKRNRNFINFVGFGVSMVLTLVTTLVAILTRKNRKKVSVGITMGLLNMLTNFSWQYWFTMRPWMLNWGTTKEERKQTYPGDDIVEAPRYQSTRAITINAPSAQVWQWLVQIGQGRGGMYSYEWLENLAGCDMHNATTIVPELQNLKLGDKVRLYPAEKFDLALVVSRIEPEKLLVLQAPESMETCFKTGFAFNSWTFILNPLDEKTTRLFFRMRANYRPDFKGIFFNQIMLEPMHFIMERKMAKTLKQIAEKSVAAKVDMPKTDTLKMVGLINGAGLN